MGHWSALVAIGKRVAFAMIFFFLVILRAAFALNTIESHHFDAVKRMLKLFCDYRIKVLYLIS